MAGVLVCLCALVACSDSKDGSDRGGDERRPSPAPRVVLSDEDRSLWAPEGSARAAAPVLLYHGVRPTGRASQGDPRMVGAHSFARQMSLLDHAGYETITLEELVRFVRGERVELPSRPLLLTFDGARADTWVAADGILRELGFTATLFVDVGSVDARQRGHLTWKELDRMQRSGRWDVQLRSGTGGHLIRYGPERADVGPFYAYRGAEERFHGWRERVFSDITWGEEQLSFRLPAYRALAFAPPYGNYGQAGTNDPRIPRALLRRLFDSFELVFTQDRSGFASPGMGDGEPLGRIEVTPGISERALHELLALPRDGAGG